MTLSVSNRNKLLFKLKYQKLTVVIETNGTFHQVQNLCHVLFVLDSRL